MMSNELAGIFTLFIFGLLFTFNSWLSLTRNHISHRGKRYHREDSPIDYWLYTGMSILLAVLLIGLGIGFSISLLLSPQTWR